MSLEGLVPAPKAGEEDYFLCEDGSWRDPKLFPQKRFLCANGKWQKLNKYYCFLKGSGDWEGLGNSLPWFPKTQKEFNSLTWEEIEQLSFDCVRNNGISGVEGKPYTDLLGFYKEETYTDMSDSSESKWTTITNRFRLVDVLFDGEDDRSKEYRYDEDYLTGNLSENRYAAFIFEAMYVCSTTMASGVPSGAAGHTIPYNQAETIDKFLTNTYRRQDFSISEDLRKVIKPVYIPCAKESRYYSGKAAMTSDDITELKRTLWLPSYSNVFGYTTSDAKGSRIAYEGEGSQFLFYKNNGITVVDKANEFTRKDIINKTTRGEYYLRTPMTTSNSSTAQVGFVSVSLNGNQSYIGRTSKGYVAFNFAI